MFKDDDGALVDLAVKSLIRTLEFPPTIADVKKEIEKIAGAATGEATAIDEWNSIKKAIGNSIYNACEMFNKLSPLAQKYVGSPNQLYQWATSTDFNSEVAKGQFLRQYDTLKEREKYTKMLALDPKLQMIMDKTAKLLDGSKD